MLLQKEPYSDSEIQSLYFSYKNNFMWFKMYLIPFGLALGSLLINLMIKEYFISSLMLINTAIMASNSHSNYVKFKNNKKEYDEKVKHNSKINQKDVQDEEDLKSLNFFKI